MNPDESPKTSSMPEAHGLNPPRTGADVLAMLRTPSDRLDVSPSGVLRIDGHEAIDLLAQFGSPLVVAVEDTIRQNYRGIRAAFASRWPATVNVMYAIKCNNTLAIRAILSQEGAGGDCFGLGELEATLKAGADPRLMVMNGSNKSHAEIEAAIQHGITINVDGEDEVDVIEVIAEREGKRARANLRLKLLPPELNKFGGEFYKMSGSLLDATRRAKWGYTLELAGALVHRLRQKTHIDLLGYSSHIGRFAAHPEAYAIVARALGDAVVLLHKETGFWPREFDLGGGWAREREPEARSPERTPYTIEDHAEAATSALLSALAPAQRPVPELWLEPGRYIVGNAQVLLATVGAIKRDAGLCWVHVDASTNNLMRIETSRHWHHILPASRMNEPLVDAAEIVGGTCIPSVLGSERRVPTLRPGDCVAILDTGMYTEVISNQFNSIPRPAAVLISGAQREIIKRRETVEDLYAQHVVPDRLKVIQ